MARINVIAITVGAAGVRLRTFGADAAKITLAGGPARHDQVILGVEGPVSRSCGRSGRARFMTTTRSPRKRILTWFSGCEKPGRHLMVSIRVTVVT